MFSAQSYEGELEASHREPLKPINNTGSKLGMGDVFRTMDKVQSHGEDTQDSGSGSAFSDLSALENEATDDFGRQLLQHHRDQQRLNSAIRGNQQAFRKARPNPRVADILDRKERERDLRQIQDHERVGSSGSNESDPPVTVPREWGRRARKQNDWMRKILEPSEPDDYVEETVKPDEDAIYPHKTAYTGDDLDWRAAEDEQNTPPSMRRQRRSTSPSSSLRHMNTTLRPTNDSSEGDFTAASLLASTPAATRLPRKIDELTRREIENIERQAVTTRALGQIDERSPDGVVRRSSSNKLRERANADGLMTSPPPLTRPVTAPGNPSSPSRIPRRRRSFLGNKENLRPNGDVNGNQNFKSSETVELVNRTAQAVNIKNTQRPRHQRNDSMNLLKKLARVSSMSPSPARDKLEVEVKDRKQGMSSNANAGPLSAKSANSDYFANTVPPTKDADAKSKHVANDVDSTSMPQETVPDAKTPAVTGGWIDTTMLSDVPQFSEVENDRQPSEPAPIDEGGEADQHVDNNDIRRVQSEPANPRSALEAIIQETKDQQSDAQFGESTIQSLEDIVHPDLDPTDPTITFEFSARNGHDENLDADQPLTQAQKDRRQEDLAIEGLNKHLRSARTSIKEASRGLRRVENRIETVQENPEASNATSAKTSTTAIQHGKHSYVHCEACGGGHRSVSHALWTELRSFFYIYNQRSKFGVRLTWLGLGCLLYALWYITETLLCWHYSHRAFSCSVWDMGGGPMPPFILPTVLFSPFRPLWEPWWRPFCKACSKGFEAVFHAVFGDIVTNEQLAFEMNAAPARATVRKVLSSTIGTRHDWIATATAVSMRAAQSVVEAVDEVGSMWDDVALS